MMSIDESALLRDAMNTGLPSHMTVHRPSDSLNGSPYSSLTQVRLEIIEQPKSRGFRFRYDCEGQSHGGLPGENSERNRRQKTYPTVRLTGYRGRARVMVSLVTDTDPPMPHAHSIVGKNSVDGRCVVEISADTDMYAQFTNLGILHVTKKKVPDVLTKRLIQQANLRGQFGEAMEIDQESPQLSPDDMSQIRSEAQALGKSMNLSVVRLCFQAFLPDEHGRFTIPVDPVFSHKVYDSKAPSAGTLKICRLDRTSGSVKGGDDVFLLCDKVQKNDIEVVLYEDKQENAPLSQWSAKGRFGPNDVHHQYAIVFQTPQFYNQAIEHPVQVWVALKRPSDQEISEPKPFLYLPQEFDEERIGQKRKKKISHFNNFFSDGGSGGGTGGTGGTGGGGPGFFRDFGGFGGGGAGAFGGSGFNFFGGGGGGTGPTGGGGGTNFQGGNSTNLHGQVFPSTTTLDSLLSSMGDTTTTHSSFPTSLGSNFTQPMQRPQHQTPPIFAATANNPGQHIYTTQQYLQPYLTPPIPHQQPLIYGRGRSNGPIVNGDGIIKSEPPDWTMDIIERDNGPSTNAPSTGSEDIRTSHGYGPKDRPRHPDPNKLSAIGGDSEDVESGYIEPDRLDSGIPSSMAVDTTQTEQEKSADTEAQAAMQALRDRQQMAFEVCDRMFNALLAWATTKDVRYLLAAQRSLTAVQNQEGDTALHLAIIHNQQEVVLQLLDVLPQLPPTETPVVDCLNNFKQSPLHLAVITRQHKVIQYLLKANGNPLVSDRNGDTPLHLACKYGFLQGILPLVSRSTRINIEGSRIPELVMRNNDGLTPLHLAAVSSNTECFRELVKANADVNVQDSKSGKTALHYLIERGDLPLTGFLITEPETNVECTDFSGNTPLHCAAARGNLAIVSLLIAAGASLIIQNQEGETPLLLAELGGHEEVVTVLREAIQQAGLEKPEEHLSTQMQSVSLTEEQKSASIPTEGDLGNLDFRPRISLALLLDPTSVDKDWKALAQRLNLSHLIGGLQSMTSPTKELLNLYEAFDGSIAELRQALLDISRNDAVNIIDRFMQEENFSPEAMSNTIKTSLDSGINSNPQSLHEQAGPSALKKSSFQTSTGITMPSTQV